jgi:hypothetical protein
MNTMPLLHRLQACTQQLPFYLLSTLCVPLLFVALGIVEADELMDSLQIAGMLSDILPGIQDYRVVPGTAEPGHSLLHVSVR